MEKLKRQNLREIYEHKYFPTMEEFRDTLVTKWQKQNAIGDTEFETLKLTLEKEYKVQGVKEFFETLYEIIYNDDARL